jgi:hypothetical protein
MCLILGSQSSVLYLRTREPFLAKYYSIGYRAPRTPDVGYEKAGLIIKNSDGCS